SMPSLNWRRHTGCLCRNPQQQNRLATAQQHRRVTKEDILAKFIELHAHMGGGAPVSVLVNLDIVQQINPASVAPGAQAVIRFVNEEMLTVTETYHDVYGMVRSSEEPPQTR